MPHSLALDIAGSISSKTETRLERDFIRSGPLRASRHSHWMHRAIESPVEGLVLFDEGGVECS